MQPTRSPTKSGTRNSSSNNPSNHKKLKLTQLEQEHYREREELLDQILYDVYLDLESRRLQLSRQQERFRSAPLPK